LRILHGATISARMTRPSSVEVLEARIAPAFVLAPLISADGKSAEFVDADGDVFTVTTTKGTFTQGNFVYMGEAETGPGYLQQINLGFAMFGKIFQGAKITVAVDQFVGDGFADVGFINASGIDLKEMVIDGDLVRIDVGDANFRTPAVKLLDAGQLGFHTAADANVTDFVSQVVGKIKALNVDTWADAAISVTGGLTAKTAKFGSIGRATVQGMAGSDLDGSGALRTTGGIGTMVIQGDLSGGSGIKSGCVNAGGKIGSLSIGGNVVGGDFEESGVVIAGAFGVVTIGGTLIGADGLHSGSILSVGSVKSLTVIGDLDGGTEELSGSVAVASAKSITIQGELIGGLDLSGIFVEKTLSRLTIGGTDATGGRVTIAVGGPAAGGIAIEKLTVTADLQGADILAGYHQDFIDPASNLVLVNSNARIGTIDIGGNLTATNIVAGIDGVNGVFGDGDDRVDPAAPKPKYLSSIASIIVGGMIEGTDGGTDQFGVLAERIGAVTVGGVPLALGKKTIDDLQLGTFGDYRLRELVVELS
jgi:hypothetical protein